MRSERRRRQKTTRVAGPQIDFPEVVSAHPPENGCHSDERVAYRTVHETGESPCGEKRDATSEHQFMWSG
jgi:hypothetical protein